MSHRWDCPDRWTAEREGREDADRQWWAREPERNHYGCDEADRHYREAFEEWREEEERAERRQQEEREEEERQEQRACQRRREEHEQEEQELYAQEQEYYARQDERDRDDGPSHTDTL